MNKVLPALMSEPYEWPKWMRLIYLCIWPIGLLLRFAIIISFLIVVSIMCAAIQLYEDARAIWTGTRPRRW